jgi:CRISPR-associated protein Csy2
MTLDDAPQQAQAAEASNKALLVLPRLRVQNANAISSPLTWGFPAITAFTGLMTAIERRLGRDAGVAFFGVGVICHGFEPQVTTQGYTRSFHLTRNPVLQDGGTAAIVEEGRVHLDITLVFDVELVDALLGDAERAALARRVGELVAGMRIAGGSVLPAAPMPDADGLRRPARASLVLMPDDEEARRKSFRRLSRRWLPGFALVSRDDLLHAHLGRLRLQDANATLLDAWLDLSRLNHRAVAIDAETAASAAGSPTAAAAPPQRVEWRTDRRVGWTVPIPVGYAALSELHPPGAVAGARDPSVSFRFVESVYSIGQWISPHRLTDVRDLLWEPQYDAATGLYRCTNDFKPSSSLSSPVPVPAPTAATAA